MTVLLLLGAIAGGWAALVYGPAYFDHFGVKEEVWLAFTRVQTDLSPAEVRTQLLRNLNSQVGWHFQLDDETGEERVQPGLGISEDAVEVTIDTELKLVRVHLEYDRVLLLKPSNRRTTVHFVAEKTGKIK